MYFIHLLLFSCLYMYIYFLKNKIDGMSLPSTATGRLRIENKFTVMHPPQRSEHYRSISLVQSTVLITVDPEIIEFSFDHT